MLHTSRIMLSRSTRLISRECRKMTPSSSSSSSSSSSTLAAAFHTSNKQEQKQQQQQQVDENSEEGEYWNPTVHYKTESQKIELPEEFNVDEFLDKEDEHRRARDLGELYTFRATPSIEHAKNSKYMVNPYKFDRRLKPVWDYNKLKAYNEAKYPAIEADPIIPPKRRSDALDEYKVKDVEVVENKVEFRYGVTSEEMLEAGVSPDPQNEQVARIFDWKNASTSELNKRNLKIAIARFQEKPGDTGSSAVQIAVLTEKINYMTEHMKKHHKDRVSQRGLQIIVNRRKKLMEYLKRKDGETYWKVVKALDLRVM